MAYAGRNLNTTYSEWYKKRASGKLQNRTLDQRREAYRRWVQKQRNLPSPANIDRQISKDTNTSGKAGWGGIDQIINKDGRGNMNRRGNAAKRARNNVSGGPRRSGPKGVGGGRKFSTGDNHNHGGGSKKSGSGSVKFSNIQAPHIDDAENNYRPQNSLPSQLSPKQRKRQNKQDRREARDIVRKTNRPALEALRRELREVKRDARQDIKATKVGGKQAHKNLKAMNRRLGKDMRGDIRDTKDLYRDAAQDTKQSFNSAEDQIAALLQQVQGNVAESANAIGAGAQATNAADDPVAAVAALLQAQNKSMGASAKSSMGMERAGAVTGMRGERLDAKRSGIQTRNDLLMAVQEHLGDARTARTEAVGDLREQRLGIKKQKGEQLREALRQVKDDRRTDLLEEFGMGIQERTMDLQEQQLSHGIQDSDRRWNMDKANNSLTTRERLFNLQVAQKEMNAALKKGGMTPMEKAELQGKLLENQLKIKELQGGTSGSSSLTNYGKGMSGLEKFYNDKSVGWKSGKAAPTTRKQVSNFIQIGTEENVASGTDAHEAAKQAVNNLPNSWFADRNTSKSAVLKSLEVYYGDYK